MLIARGRHNKPSWGQEWGSWDWQGPRVAQSSEKQAYGTCIAAFWGGGKINQHGTQAVTPGWHCADPTPPVKINSPITASSPCRSSPNLRLMTSSRPTAHEPSPPTARPAQAFVQEVDAASPARIIGLPDRHGIEPAIETEVG